jgi:hypothetical protein
VQYAAQRRQQFLPKRWAAPLNTPPPLLPNRFAAVALVLERDAVALTRARPGGPPAVAITSRLPRFQELYTLRVAPRWLVWAGEGGGREALEGYLPPGC